MLKYLSFGDRVALVFGTLVAVIGSQAGCGGNFTALSPDESPERAPLPPAFVQPEKPEFEAAPAPPAETNWPNIAALDQLREGATVATGWGLRTEIPNDTFHSWSFDAPGDWADAYRTALLRTTEQLNDEIDWVVSFDEATVESTDVEVLLDARAASEECALGTGTCWLGQTACLENETQLGEYRVCKRWYINLAMKNIEAWSLRKGASAVTALQTIFRHELGHSLGFAHGDGIMIAMASSLQLKGQVSVEYTPCQKARLSAYTRFVGVDAQVTEVTPAACAR